MFNERNKVRNGTPARPGQRLPEVVDQQPAAEHGPSSTYAETEIASFKVFLKRNMRPQLPPVNLLGDIRDRINKITARD